MANTKNYMEPGGEVWHVGGKLEFDGGGAVANQAASTADTVALLKEDVNALLIKLKDSGLMVPDAFTMTVSNGVTDTDSANANRTYNTGKISSVAESNGVITITLSAAVSALKDFDGGGSWGTHKWLGIGVSVGISPITGLKYNGSNLTSADASEATAVGLSAGYFVRWVAADLVLAGDNSQASKNTFTLKAPGYAETEYTLRIVEPS